MTGVLPLAPRLVVQPKAWLVTAENIFDLERALHGSSVKGTLLPPQDRVLQFYGGGGGRLGAQEQTARVGDYVVQHREGDFEAMSSYRFFRRYCLGDARDALEASEAPEEREASLKLRLEVLEARFDELSRRRD